MIRAASAAPDLFHLLGKGDTVTLSIWKEHLEISKLAPEGKKKKQFLQTMGPFRATAWLAV
jgi:hypothetical protein